MLRLNMFFYKLFIGLLFFQQILLAGTGIISGIVKDNLNEKPIPNVKIFLTGTEYKSTTNNFGSFRIDDVDARKIQIKCCAQKFRITI